MHCRHFSQGKTQLDVLNLMPDAQWGLNDLEFAVHPFHKVLLSFSSGNNSQNRVICEWSLVERVTTLHQVWAGPSGWRGGLLCVHLNISESRLVVTCQFHGWPIRFSPSLTSCSRLGSTCFLWRTLDVRLSDFRAEPPLIWMTSELLSTSPPSSSCTQ